MKCVLLLMTLLVSPVWSSVVELLPTPLNNLKINVTNKSEVEQRLGKPDLVEGSYHYWEREGLKYALRLSYDKKAVLNSIHFTFTTNKPSIDKLDLKQTDKLVPYPAKGKSAGRFFLHKEKNAEVIIDPISKTIHTVKIQ